MRPKITHSPPVLTLAAKTSRHYQAVTIQQSHGGSSKQALSVANGLKADVVTMNQTSDVELLVKKSLVDKNWQQAFLNNAVPYTSTMVLLVRNNNPKQIKDWDDLAKPYLKGLWDTPAQEIMGKNYLRPVDAATLAKYQSQFPAITTFEPNQVFGSWDEIMSKFFKDGAIFDQLAVKK